MRWCLKSQPYDCLPNGLFKRRSNKTSKLRVTGLCEGNSPVTVEFPAQRANDAENVSIWWRHHVIPEYDLCRGILVTWITVSMADSVQQIISTACVIADCHNTIVQPEHNLSYIILSCTLENRWNITGYYSIYYIGGTMWNLSYKKVWIQQRK